MKGVKLLHLLGLSLCFILSGCVVRTYQLTKDRVDQDLTTGNRGYLKGGAPTQETKERKATRTTQVVEIELRSPIKFEKTSQAKPLETTKVERPEEEQNVGNRGYITQSQSPAVAESTIPTLNIKKYTVQKNDTLQKISQRFYGTTKKWTKIYDANKDRMKGPNKIYPGQVLNIPVTSDLKSATGSLKEPKENLK